MAKAKNDTQATTETKTQAPQAATPTDLNGVALFRALPNIAERYGKNAEAVQSNLEAGFFPTHVHRLSGDLLEVAYVTEDGDLVARYVQPASGDKLVIGWHEQDAFHRSWRRLVTAEIVKLHNAVYQWRMTPSKKFRPLDIPQLVTDATDIKPLEMSDKAKQDALDRIQAKEEKGIDARREELEAAMDKVASDLFPDEADDAKPAAKKAAPKTRKAGATAKRGRPKKEQAPAKRRIA